MEDSPLNKAHLELRLGYRNESKGNYLEAIKNHERALGYFQELMTLTTDNVVATSISLQLQHCERRITVLRYHSFLLLNLLKKLARMPKIPLSSDSSAQPSPYQSKGSDSAATPDLSSHKLSEDYISSVLKNSHEMERLISNLNANLSLKADSSQSTASENKIFEMKDVKMIVDRMELYNSQNLNLMKQVSSEIAALQRENSTLKTQVSDLQTQINKLDSDGVRPMSDSTSSPYVFSPLGEYSPIHCSLPDLPPLELPSLDFLDNPTM